MDKVNEGNRLIAEFMGYKFLEGEIIDGSTIYMLSELKYHSSWDWLMPVVEKIRNLRTGICVQLSFDKNLLIVSMYDYENEFQITQQRHKPTDINTPNYITWLAVVEFINWYNKNKNNG